MRALPYLRVSHAGTVIDRPIRIRLRLTPEHQPDELVFLGCQAFQRALIDFRWLACKHLTQLHPKHIHAHLTIPKA